MLFPALFIKISILDCLLIILLISSYSVSLREKLDPSSYITPRAQGKPYETVAFHFIRLAYNPYCLHELNNEDEMLSYEHFGFKSSFLETIGLSVEDMKDKQEVTEESDYESINEALNIEPNFN